MLASSTFYVKIAMELAAFTLPVVALLFLLCGGQERIISRLKNIMKLPSDKPIVQPILPSGHHYIDAQAAR